MTFPSTPKGHQQCWILKSHKETPITGTKTKTGRSNIMSFYMDKPLENSRFQIISNRETQEFQLNFWEDCVTTSKQVISLCLVFSDSFFSSVLAPCSFWFLQLPCIPSSPALLCCFSYVSVSLKPDSHVSLHPFLFLKSIHLSSYQFILCLPAKTG